MYVCVCKHVDVRMYMYSVFVCIYKCIIFAVMYVCMCIYIYVKVHMYTHICTRINRYMCIYTHKHLCVCRNVYVYVYVYVCIYIYIHMYGAAPLLSLAAVPSNDNFDRYLETPV